MPSVYHLSPPTSVLTAPVGVNVAVPKAALHLSGTLVNASYTDVLAANAYFNTGWRYLSAGPAWMLGGAGGNGTVFRILTAVAGTADANVTWRDSLMVDAANGYVGIGKVPAARLDVAGSVACTLPSTGIWCNFNDTTTHNFQVGGDAQFIYWNTTTNSGYRFNCANSEKFRIAVDGTLSHRGNATIIVDANSHIGLRSYTIATMPSAATAARLINISNGSGNRGLAISDGTVWRWTDGTVAA